MVRTPRASLPVAAIPVPASTIGRSRRPIRQATVAPDLDVARSPARNTTAGPVGQPVARSIRRRWPITRGMAAGMSTHLRRTAGAVSASRTGHPPPVDGAVPRISDVPDRVTAAAPLARAPTSVAERSNEAADCASCTPTGARRLRRAAPQSATHAPHPARSQDGHNVRRVQTPAGAVDHRDRCGWWSGWSGWSEWSGGGECRASGSAVAGVSAPGSGSRAHAILASGARSLPRPGRG